ncbi:MAG: hypothetical protein GY928_06180 [Colwellia sp.]|nr:hypothetical protein [Colwellia sp.]
MVDLSFFSSPAGVTIAWVCSVLGVVMALFQRGSAVKFEQEVNSLNIINNELKSENINLVNKITSIENNEIRDNYQDVTQTGKNNINQGVVTGDVNIDLS